MKNTPYRYLEIKERLKAFLMKRSMNVYYETDNYYNKIFKLMIRSITETNLKEIHLYTQQTVICVVANFKAVN